MQKCLFAASSVILRLGANFPVHTWPGFCLVLFCRPVGSLWADAFVGIVMCDLYSARRAEVFSLDQLCEV